MTRGVAFQYNALKLTLLNAFVKNGIDKPLSCRQLATITGLDRNYISAAMNRYRKNQGCCFRRLKSKQKGSKDFFYKINRRGIIRYFNYLKRAKRGYDLNLRHKNPEKKSHWNGMKSLTEEEINEGLTNSELTNYITITKQGATELGLLDNPELVLRAAGILRDSEDAK